MSSQGRIQSPKSHTLLTEKLRKIKPGASKKLCRPFSRQLEGARIAGDNENAARRLHKGQNSSLNFTKYLAYAKIILLISWLLGIVQEQEFAEMMLNICASLPAISFWNSRTAC